jgi:S-adenosylmethionine uptake transporter
MKAATVAQPLAFAAAAVAIAVFSCMDAVIKALSLGIGPYNALLWRAVAGTAISGSLFLARGVGWPAKDMVALHVKRSVAAGCSVLLFFWGLVRIPMAEGVALTFLAPMFAILLAVPMLGERVKPRALGACALAFAGVLLIVAGKRGEAAGAEAVHGAIACVAASIFYAYNLVLLRRSAQAAGPIEITFFTNLVMLGLFGIASPWAGEVPAVFHWWQIVLAATLGIVSSLLLAWAYSHAETQAIVPVEYTAFVWAALLGWLIFDERLVALTIAGAAMIVGGCLIAVRAGAVPPTEAAS